jgi:hypothetical protein
VVVDLEVKIHQTPEEAAAAVLILKEHFHLTG